MSLTETSPNIDRVFRGAVATPAEILPNAVKSRLKQVYVTSRLESTRESEVDVSIVSVENLHPLSMHRHVQGEYAFRAEMANQGAKKRHEENKRHVKRLAMLVLFSNGFYVFFRMAIFSTSTSWKHFIGIIFTSGVYYLTYEWIKDLAKATVTENGELTDGGADMSGGGICGYLHDVLYITCFVHLGSVVSDKAWYTFLLIPMFAFYKLWQMVLYPYFFQSPKEEPENEVSRKKREKAERKASRPKFGKVRK